MFRRTNFTIPFIISFCLGVGLIVALLYKVGLGKITVFLSQTSWPLMALAVVTYAGSWLFRTWRLACFTTGQAPSMLRLFKIQIAGFATNAIFPMKLGDALMILGLRAVNIGIGNAAAIVIQLRILDLFTILMATAPLALVKIQVGTPDWLRHTVSFLGIIACLPLLFILLSRFTNLIRFFEHNASKIHYAMLRFFMFKVIDACKAYEEIISHGRRFLATAFMSLLVWLMEGSTTAVVALALNIPVPLYFVLPAMAAANLGKAAPVTPGGIGVYESIMALTLTLAGIHFDNAIAIAICDHILKKSFNVGLGLPCIPGLLGPNWKNNLKSIYIKLKQLKKNEEYGEVSGR